MRTFSLVRSFVCSAAMCTCASDHATCFVNLRARARNILELGGRTNRRCGHLVVGLLAWNVCADIFWPRLKAFLTFLRAFIPCTKLICVEQLVVMYYYWPLGLLRRYVTADSRRVHKSSLFDGPFSPLVFVGVSVVCTDRVSYSAREMQCIAVPVIQESRLSLRLTTLVHDRPISAV